MIKYQLWKSVVMSYMSDAATNADVLTSCELKYFGHGGKMGGGRYSSIVYYLASFG